MSDDFLSDQRIKLDFHTAALLDPTTRQPVNVLQEGLIGHCSEAWPLLDGIPYLRTGRDEIRDASVAAIQRGDFDQALAVLLTDQDPFAPEPPPSIEQALAVVHAQRRGDLTLRKAMRDLRFGPVEHYFSHRGSTPTFLSGLALLSQHEGVAVDNQFFSQRPTVEIACGIGSFLRVLDRFDHRPTLGIDLVFAKLWLAHHFVSPESAFVCGDPCLDRLLAWDDCVDVFCHDAIYFFPDKPAAVDLMGELAGVHGQILIGHAHNVFIDHGVAGTPWSPQDYAALLNQPLLYDDADLAQSARSGSPASPKTVDQLATSEAIAMVWPDRDRFSLPDRLLWPQDGTTLRLNPLLVQRQGQLVPNWPMPQFAIEYQDADYLYNHAVPSERILAQAAQGYPGRGRDLEMDQLVRDRILIDWSEHW